MMFRYHHEHGVADNDCDDSNGAIAVWYGGYAENVGPPLLSESTIMDVTRIIRAEITTIFCPS